MRPVTYAAKGTHANYASPGGHSLPLRDHTNRGKFWDPTLSVYRYAYNKADGTFTAAQGGHNPLGLVRFNGRWGDQEYPDSDPRQLKLFHLDLATKFKNGPNGPRDKHLGRKNICKDDKEWCVPWDNLTAFFGT